MRRKFRSRSSNLLHSALKCTRDFEATFPITKKLDLQLYRCELPRFFVFVLLTTIDNTNPVGIDVSKQIKKRLERGRREQTVTTQELKAQLLEL